MHDMRSSGELTTSQRAEAAGCSKRAIIGIPSNVRLRMPTGEASDHGETV